MANKCDWTMAKAKAWVKEHEKSVLISTTTNSENDDEIVSATVQTDDITIVSPRARGTSQGEIVDEIDYLTTLIIAEGISEKTKPTVWVLVKEILRLSGNDIPVDIRASVSIATTNSTQATMADETKVTLTNQDILEAIKRIAKI